jgi:hypothetical protein
MEMIQCQQDVLDNQYKLYSPTQEEEVVEEAEVENPMAFHHYHNKCYHMENHNLKSCQEMGMLVEVEAVV